MRTSLFPHAAVDRAGVVIPAAPRWHRRVVARVKRTQLWASLFGPRWETERRLGEIRDRLDDLARRVERGTAVAEALRAETQRIRQEAAERDDRLRAEISRLGQRLDDLGTVRGELQASREEIAASIRAIQLNQVELSRPGPLTFRVATSTQPSLRLARLPDGTLSFVADRGGKPHRVAVISIPKSGTYFVAEVLAALGYVNTHVQAWAHGVHDYRDLTLQQMVTDYLSHYVAMPIEVSAPLVHPGQFWVGHFEVALCREALREFAKLFMVRDLRLTLVSYMRWLSRPGRGGPTADAWRHLPDAEEKFVPFFETHGRPYLAWCRDIIGWLDLDDVCVVRFEEIAGLRGDAPQRAASSAVAGLLGEPAAAVVGAIQRSLGTETKTFSGRYSSLEGIWSDRVQALFAAAGGTELNRRLGYAGAGPDA